MKINHISLSRMRNAAYVQFLILLAAAAAACNEGFKTVKIGGQTWMAENLNYEAEGSKCYDNDPANCAKYGRLYDWATAMTVCPSGWHLPSNEEWDMLSRYADGTSGTGSIYNSHTAGRYLKAASGWNNSYNGASGNGEDAYGFSALPGGYGNSGGSFGSVGNDGNWWSASEGSAGYAYYWLMSYYLEDAFWGNGVKSFYLFSVRCVK